MLLSILWWSMRVLIDVLSMTMCRINTDYGPLVSVNVWSKRLESGRAKTVSDFLCLNVNVCCVQETQFNACDHGDIISKRFTIFSAYLMTAWLVSMSLTANVCSWFHKSSGDTFCDRFYNKAFHLCTQQRCGVTWTDNSSKCQSSNFSNNDNHVNLSNMTLIHFSFSYLLCLSVSLPEQTTVSFKFCQYVYKVFSLKYVFVYAHSCTVLLRHKS